MAINAQELSDDIYNAFYNNLLKDNKATIQGSTQMRPADKAAALSAFTDVEKQYKAVADDIKTAIIKQLGKAKVSVKVDTQNDLSKLMATRMATVLVSPVGVPLSPVFPGDGGAMITGWVIKDLADKVSAEAGWGTAEKDGDAIS